MNITSTTPVNAFFEAFGKGHFQRVLDTFHPKATVTAVRKSERHGNEIYGIYNGIEDVKTFLSNMGNAFETQSFTVENVVGGEGVAFATVSLSTS